MARVNRPPTSRYVYATATCGTATADGIGIVLREGDTWAADDPLVIARPGLFADTPPGPNFPRRTVHAVEPAPAEPSEHRRLRR
jgi:hypothetical protein